MKDLVFRENDNKHDVPVIEVGDWCERNDGSKFFSSLLDIDPVNKEVYTDCGDAYMDYSVSFETFLAIADKIRELERREDENVRDKA